MRAEKPWILDAFSGVGGATKGYQLAGFRVFGVDHAPQPDYCGDDFHQGDAIEFIARYGHKFAAIVGSPPCQAGCTLTAGTNAGRAYPQLIPQTRAAMWSTGRPWVIENPPGRAPMRRDLLLCGDHFYEDTPEGRRYRLAVIRHRIFELHGFSVPQPPRCSKKHRGRVSGMRHGKWFTGPYVAVYGDGGGKGTVEQWRAAMGIDWTWDRKAIAEAIPPLYTEYIGGHLMAALGRCAA